VQCSVIQLQGQPSSIYQRVARKPPMYILMHVGCVTVALVFYDIDPLSSRIDCRSNMSMLSHGFSPKETTQSVHPFVGQGYAQRLQRTTGTQVTANRLTTEQAVRAIQHAFAPLRCEAEIWDKGQKMRFRLFGPNDSTLLKADEITRAQFQDHTSLSSTIEITRDTLARYGFEESLSTPVAIRQSSQANALTRGDRVQTAPKKTHGGRWNLQRCGRHTI